MRLPHLFLLVFSLAAVALPAQRQGYWQQEVHYVMDVVLNTTNHHMQGRQKITYTNHSADTLYRLFYHLYFNAFQPNSTMDYRSRHLPDPDPRVGARIQGLSDDEQGWHRIQTLTCRGKKQEVSITGTLMEVALSSPIVPGETVELHMEFQSQVPIQIRRSGRNSAEGIDYSMTQWYPKLAVFDEDGWHTDPYIGREFYGNFGTFDVWITLPEDYTIGATGVLQNPSEIGHGYSSSSSLSNKPKGFKKENMLRWHFKAENVHDFAWAADPDYQHTTLKVPNGPTLRFLYLPDYNKDGKWDKLAPLCQQLFEAMGKSFGPYPYPEFSFVQGGDGGMEYPNLTLITASGDLNGLVQVAFHEAIHNWFYGLFGFHEGRYPWMDEGFTTYATDLMNEVVLDDPNWPFYAQFNRAYLLLVEDPNRQPMSTHADWYRSNRAYSLSAYIGGAVFLNQLRYIVGWDVFNEGMHRFYRNWKFKHPKPEDFLREMERVSQMELDWYLREFIYSTHTIDYGIDSVWSEGSNTKVRLKRFGDFPMPIDLLWENKSGKKGMAFISLDVQRGSKKAKFIFSGTYLKAPVWDWVRHTYVLEIPEAMKQLKLIQIDPDQEMVDINPSNNLWEP